MLTIDEFDEIIQRLYDAGYVYPEQYPPVVLGGLTGYSYPAETAAKYYNAMDQDEIVFFEEVAEWGDDYTGILSLRTSDEEGVNGTGFYSGQEWLYVRTGGGYNWRVQRHA